MYDSAQTQERDRRNVPVWRPEGVVVVSSNQEGILVKLRICLFSAIAAFIMAAASPSIAAEGAGSDEAKSLLNKAAAYLEKEGPAKAFCAFNDPNGPFRNGELYVFAFNRDGTIFANSAAPAQVGTSYVDIKDAAGQPIGKNIMDIARSQGEGSLDYVWLNRVTNKVEKKRSFILNVDEFALGVGYYMP
jgi:cytochrome c